jgi:hypothetical protein
MTVPPMTVAPSVHLAPPSPHLREARRARGPRRHLVPAIVTAVGVGAGLLLVSMTVAGSPSPGSVARQFVEARFEQDWATVWDLHCRVDTLPDPDAFAERMSLLDDGFAAPAGTAIVVKDVVEQAGAETPSFTVTVRVLAVGPDGEHLWADTVLLPVVGDAGEFRVCLTPAGTP